MGVIAFLIFLVLVGMIIRVAIANKKGKQVNPKPIYITLIAFFVSLVGFGIQNAVIAHHYNEEVSSSESSASSVTKHNQDIDSKKAHVKVLGDSSGLYANKDNILNINFEIDKPAKVTYKIDDDTEAKMISFKKLSDNKYKAIVQMLKTSKSDSGVDLYVYTNRNGYKYTKDLFLLNYANLQAANDAGQPESTTDKWNDWLKSHLVDTGQAVGATAQKNGDNYIINVKGYDEWMNEDDNSLESQLDFIRQRIIGNFDKFQGNAPRINVYSQGHLIAYTSANNAMGNMQYRNKEARKQLGWIK